MTSKTATYFYGLLRPFPQLVSPPAAAAGCPETGSPCFGTGYIWNAADGGVWMSVSPAVEKVEWTSADRASHWSADDNHVPARDRGVHQGAFLLFMFTCWMSTFINLSLFINIKIILFINHNLIQFNLISILPSVYFKPSSTFDHIFVVE